jgi:hypothetical protein
MMFSRAAVGGNTLGALAFNAGNFVEETGGTGMVAAEGNASLSARFSLGGVSLITAPVVMAMLRRRQFATAASISITGLTLTTRLAQFVALSKTCIDSVGFVQIRPTLNATAITKFQWDLRLDYRYLRPTDRERCRQIQPHKTYVVGKEDRRVAIHPERRTVFVARDRETI